MKAKMLTIGAALALLAVPATAMAGHANDEGQSHDNFPGLPGAALFGLCNAADNAGNDNGNGTSNGTWMNAPPFAWLFANEDCEDVSHPSEDKPEQAEAQAEQADDDAQASERGQGQGPPDHAGGPPDR